MRVKAERPLWVGAVLGTEDTVDPSRAQTLLPRLAVRRRRRQVFVNSHSTEHHAAKRHECRANRRRGNRAGLTRRAAPAAGAEGPP